MGVTAGSPRAGSHRPNPSFALTAGAQMARDSQQLPNRWTRETEEQVGHQRPDKGSSEAWGLAADEGRQRDSCKQEGACDMPWPLTSNELMAAADATQ